jgi:hypothetical protein
MNEIYLLRTQLRHWNLYGEIPMSNGREHVVQENPYSVTMRRASTKGGPQTVHAESMLEHDFFCILDFDQRVEKYKEQAVVVPWKDSKGRFRRYTPDVLVKFRSSEHHEDQAHVLSTIFEIKPYPVVKHNWAKLAEKIRGIKKTLDGTGVEFKLVTERQIKPTFLKNVRFLLDYESKKLINDQRLTDSQHARMMRVRDSIPKVGVTTPRLILNSITDDVIEQAYLVPWIWNFLRGGSLQADLITPLTMDTEVWDVLSKHPRAKWMTKKYDWYR